MVSTNTGNNTSYSNCEETRQLAQRTVVYQQPALQLRTKYAVEKQFGSLPLSVSYAPDYSSLTLPGQAKLLLLIAGEFKRLFSYSKAPHHFFRRPEHFDSRVTRFFQEHSAQLKELEAALFSSSG
ncbi:MAG: hypothetical protein GY801_15460 [bacterium]|nr:hypothetical protein [bacterium]